MKYEVNYFIHISIKIFKTHTFDTKSTDLIKMVAVYVRIYPEQSTNYGLDGITEVPRERHT